MPVSMRRRRRVKRLHKQCENNLQECELQEVERIKGRIGHHQTTDAEMMGRRDMYIDDLIVNSYHKNDYSLNI